MKAFFNSQFSYCPLIWMCHIYTNNREINNPHERCLRVIYNDKTAIVFRTTRKGQLVLFLFIWEISNLWLLKCFAETITSDYE